MNSYIFVGALIAKTKASTEDSRICCVRSRSSFSSDVTLLGNLEKSKCYKALKNILMQISYSYDSQKGFVAEEFDFSSVSSTFFAKCS